jgi:hypothetical protein
MAITDMATKYILDMARDKLALIYTGEDALIDQAHALLTIMVMLDLLTQDEIIKSPAPGLAIKIPNPIPYGDHKFPELLRTLADMFEARNNLSENREENKQQKKEKKNEVGIQTDPSIQKH